MSILTKHEFLTLDKDSIKSLFENTEYYEYVDIMPIEQLWTYYKKDKLHQWTDMIYLSSQKHNEFNVLANKINREIRDFDLNRRPDHFSKNKSYINAWNIMSELSEIENEYYSSPKTINKRKLIKLFRFMEETLVLYKTIYNTDNKNLEIFRNHVLNTINQLKEIGINLQQWINSKVVNNRNYNKTMFYEWESHNYEKIKIDVNSSYLGAIKFDFDCDNIFTYKLEPCDPLEQFENLNLNDNKKWVQEEYELLVQIRSNESYNVRDDEWFVKINNMLKRFAHNLEHESCIKMIDDYSTKDNYTTFNKFLMTVQNLLIDMEYWLFSDVLKNVVNVEYYGYNINYKDFGRTFFDFVQQEDNGIKIFFDSLIELEAFWISLLNLRIDNVQLFKKENIEKMKLAVETNLIHITRQDFIDIIVSRAGQLNDKILPNLMII